MTPFTYGLNSVLVIEEVCTDVGITLPACISQLFVDKIMIPKRGANKKERIKQKERVHIPLGVLTLAGAEDEIAAIWSFCLQNANESYLCICFRG
jgi:hypothetical protein